MDARHTYWCWRSDPRNHHSMKLNCNISSTRHQAGTTLIECMVYLMVFPILLGVALGSFCVCWDGFRAMISTTDEVSAALGAGERWRSDVRDAGGIITVETTSLGQVVKIPENGTEIIYSFNSNGLRRQTGAEGFSQVIFPKVKSSEMKFEMRGTVKAWQWELELPELRKGPHLPMLFTFEAAQKTE